MKLWVDDVRPAPSNEYHWVKSVNAAKRAIEYLEMFSLIDIDHDAGEYVSEGGDYIKLLDWLEETGRSYPIRIHSMNPVGIMNMRKIIERNGWKEVK